MAHFDLQRRADEKVTIRPIELELAVGRRPVMVVASRASQRRIQAEQAATVVVGLIPAPELACLGLISGLPAPVGRTGWL